MINQKLIKYKNHKTKTKKNSKNFSCKRFLLIGVIFLTLLNSLSALDLEFHGKGDVDFASAFWNTSDILLAKAQFSPKIELFHDDFYALVSLKSSYNALNPRNFDLALGEIYAEYAWDFFDFRIGRQIISWGKADGLAITDILCSKDYTAFLDSDYKNTRIPLTGIQLRFFDSFYTIEGIWVPLHTGYFPKYDTTNPMNSIIFPNEVEMKGFKFATEYQIKEDKHKHRIQDGEWALRASFFFPAIDFSLSAFRGWDHEAKFETFGKLTPWNIVSIKPFALNPLPKKAMITITPSHNRIWMAGFDMAIPIDMFILKAEAAWIGKREFINKDAKVNMLKGEFSMPLTKHHQLKALLALEINPGAGWMINMQYMEDVVFENTDKLERNQRLPMITGFVSKTLLREKMKLSAGIVIGCDAWDTASSIGISYKVIDNLKLSLDGSLYCKGKKEGIFGKMNKLSNIKAGLEFSF